MSWVTDYQHKIQKYRRLNSKGLANYIVRAA